MKCNKCKTENIIKANYCKNCGNKFTDNEQKQAKRKTLVGKLEIMEKAYKACTLQVITGSLPFKVISLVLVIILGVYLFLNNGNYVKIMESKNYEIKYDTENKEYYLLVDKASVNVDLYIPNRFKSMNINQIDKDKNVIDSFKYKENKDLVLKSSESEYYSFDINYEDKKNDKMVLHVLRVDMYE